MGKAIKKVFAELLSDEAKRRGILSDRQFSRRRGQSAIDAVAIMDGRAHAAWRDGQIVCMLLMDIKASIPGVAKGSLVNMRMVRRMDGDLI